MKKMIFSLLVLFTCSFHTHIVLGHSLNPIIKHNLAMYPWVDEDWPNESYGQFLDRCMTYQKVMQPFKKYRVSWDILNRYILSIAQSNTSDNVLNNDLTTCQNLQLLRAEQEENISCCIANLIDRTSTAIGKVTLYSWIAQPTSDTKILQKRQSVIRYLIENEDLFNALDAYLQTLQSNENFFLSFWSNDPLKPAAQKHYFKFSAAQCVEKCFNENIPLLTITAIIEHAKRICSVLSIATATAILPPYGILHSIDNDHENHLSTLAHRLIGSGGPFFSLMTLINNRYVQSLGFIAAGFYCGLQTQDCFEWMRDNFILEKYLQTKLIHVSQYVKHIQKIAKVCEKHSPFPFTDTKNISQIIQELTMIPEIKRLFSLLNSSTFNENPSFFSHWGKILLAYKLMHEHKDHLEEVLCAIGELDAYMSAARLYKEFENKPVHYSFAQYDTSSSHPFMIIENLWSPFIDPTCVIPNSIEMGTSSSNQTIIITGPNEGGKSTFAKTVATVLILAQSIGIIPASYAEFTPFSYIATYLNITDDHGKSLFEAQVQRAKKILDHIDTLPQNNYSFVIIDELFNGTDALVGQATSYSIADYLSKNLSVLSIFPTHFPLLTTLENNGHTTNYHVTAHINEKGTISYPFIVDKGISTQNIVFDILKNEEFNQIIIDQAHAQLTKNH